MKKRITLLGVLLIAATVTWTMGFRNNDTSTELGKLIPAPEKEQAEIVKAVNQIIELHNSNKSRSLRKIFPSGNVSSKVWEMTGQKDPVAQSINTLQECGKKLRLQSPQVLKVNNSAKNNHSYVVKAVVNEAGDMLEFKITKRKKYFSLAGISKIQS